MSKEKIQLIAPSHHIYPKHITNAIFSSKKLGYDLKYSPSIHQRTLSFAGSPERRANEIHQAFKDPAVILILAACGGNGCIEILPHLDYKLIKKNPKPIIGFSDISILLNTINQRCGHIMIHGPSQKHSWKHLSKDEQKSIINCIHKKSFKQTFEKKDILFPSTKIIKGKTSGGCLSLLVDSLATPYEIKTKNSILFLEDVDIKGRRLYTLLVQLKLAGKFQKVKAIVLGNFKNCLHAKPYLTNFFKNLTLPTVHTSLFGHGKLNHAFPIGAQAEINFDKKEIRYHFKAR
ncbi:hypothetical protein CMO92_01370 [Candidatus Woesearchaeota archaeon]|nr:hypothetical protein [Candidatus Woesearchaeota archaeon]|tara:strand:+ start:2024 stop:2893 length:870 start_codon:yes stop_codon:yes gene_type:complete